MRFVKTIVTSFQFLTLFKAPTSQNGQTHSKGLREDLPFLQVEYFLKIKSHDKEIYFKEGV